MKKFVFVLMLLAAATASNAYGDKYGTVSLTVTTPGDPIINMAGTNGIYLGPYTYGLSGALDNPSSLGIPAGTSPQTYVKLSAAVANNPTILGFCSDFTHDAVNASASVFSMYDTSLTNGLGHYASGTGANKLATIDTFDVGNNYYGTVIGKLVTAYSVYGSPDNLPPLTVNNNSSGLQMAIWAVLQASAINGPGSASDLVNHATQYQTFPNGMSLIAVQTVAINLLNTYSTELAYADVQAIVPDTGQVQAITFDLSGVPSAGGVPEPTGLVALAGLAFVGLPVGANVWFRRRRRVA